MEGTVEAIVQRGQVGVHEVPHEREQDVPLGACEARYQERVHLQRGGRGVAEVTEGDGEYKHWTER